MNGSGGSSSVVRRGLVFVSPKNCVAFYDYFFNMSWIGPSEPGAVHTSTGTCFVPFRVVWQSSDQNIGAFIVMLAYNFALLDAGIFILSWIQI